MKNLIQDIVFKKLLKDTGINPAEIEAVDPIIVTPQSNVERFYEWLKRCNNVYLTDNNQVTKAFHKIHTHG